MSNGAAMGSGTGRAAGRRGTGGAGTGRAQWGALRLVVLLALLAVALGVLVWSVRERAGVGREVREVAVGPCLVVPAPAGPEDLQIDEATGLAFVSAFDRRADPERARGGIYTLDVRDPQARPRRLERDGPAAFRPHGLSLIRQEDELYLHVVNHPPGGHTVERFVFRDGGLVHLATVAGEALVSPNDVAAVDAERFYVTNDHGTHGGIARTLERLLGLNLADVQYYDGERFVTAIDGLTMPNGIVLSAGGDQVVVAETLDDRLTWYDREPASGRLAPHAYYDLATAPDNLNVAADGALWFAGHPRLFDFLAHADDREAEAPSEVHRLVLDRGARDRVMFADDGDVLSAASVADALGGVFLVGAVFEPRLLRCGGRRDPLGEPGPEAPVRDPDRPAASDSPR